MPKVTNIELHRLLYPQMMTFSDVAVMMHNTRVSVTGKISRVYIHSFILIHYEYSFI